VLREDPSRAAHPGPTGQGRARREAGGRPLAATVGDAAAVSWLLSSFHPLFADPGPASWFPAVAAGAAWAGEGGRGCCRKGRIRAGTLPGSRVGSHVWIGWQRACPLSDADWMKPTLSPGGVGRMQTSNFRKRPLKKLLLRPFRIPRCARRSEIPFRRMSVNCSTRSAWPQSSAS